MKGQSFSLYYFIFLALVPRVLLLVLHGFEEYCKSTDRYLSNFFLNNKRQSWSLNKTQTIAVDFKDDETLQYNVSEKRY